MYKLSRRTRIPPLKGIGFYLEWLWIVPLYMTMRVVPRGLPSLTRRRDLFDCDISSNHVRAQIQILLGRKGQRAAGKRKEGCHLCLRDGYSDPYGIPPLGFSS